MEYCTEDEANCCGSMELFSFFNSLVSITLATDMGSTSMLHMLQDQSGTCRWAQSAFISFLAECFVEAQIPRCLTTLGDFCRHAAGQVNVSYQVISNIRQGSFAAVFSHNVLKASESTSTAPCTRCGVSRRCRQPPENCHYFWKSVFMEFW